MSSDCASRQHWQQKFHAIHADGRCKQGHQAREHITDGRIRQASAEVM